MRTNNTKGLFARMLLVVSLLFGFVALTGTTVQAQGYRSYDRHHRGRVIVRPRARVFVTPRVIYPRAYVYNRPYSYVPSSHVTEGQGYRDGLNDGRDDARDRDGFNPYRHNDYKNAETSGYINGYLRGYEEGYR